MTTALYNPAIERFRELIHHVAQEARDTHNYDPDSMNGWLAEVGVMPVSNHECDRWIMTLTVQVTVSGTTSEDTAQEWARNALSSSDSDVEFSRYDIDASEPEAACTDSECPHY